MDYNTVTRDIVQYAFIVNANLQEINNNYMRSDSSIVFPSLTEANKIKGSMHKSYKRYVESENIHDDGITRTGTKGNKIKWRPLPEDFNIHTHLFRKPNTPGYELPEWTTATFKSQWGDYDIPAKFRKAGYEAMPPLPPPSPVPTLSPIATSKKSPMRDHVNGSGADGAGFDSAYLNTAHWNDGNFMGRACTNVKGSSANDNRLDSADFGNGYVDRNVGDGWVGLGEKSSVIRQGECYEGEVFDFTLQLQMSPDDHIGTTGFPFNIQTWRTSRGGVDSKDIPHDTMTIFLPCPHLASSPLMKEKKHYPRFDKNGNSIILYIRSKCTDRLKHSIPCNSYFNIVIIFSR